MSEELYMTLEGLEVFYSAQMEEGWDLKVYDYTSNTWREAADAFRRAGTYENAVMTRAGSKPIRIRLLPSGKGGLMIDVASVGDKALWRSLGVQLGGRHLGLLVRMLEDHSGEIMMEELVALLRTCDDPLASEVIDALGYLVPSEGDGP